MASPSQILRFLILKAIFRKTYQQTLLPHRSFCVIIKENRVFAIVNLNTRDVKKGF